MTNIGERVYAHDLTIPVGTIVDIGSGRLMIREVDGWHVEGERQRHYPYPSQATQSGTVTEMVPYVETLAMHQQRFAVTCANMGHRAGGGGYLEGAYSIIERLGLEDPRNERLRIGSWVAGQVNGALTPRGTVLLSGATDRAVGHTLFIKTDGYPWATPLAGPRRDLDYLLMQVVGLPTDYVTDDWPEPAEDEQDLIRQFRIRAWEEGWREKGDRSWCGDFESSISVLGLSDHVANLLRAQTPAVVGSPFNPQVGAVLTSVEELAAAPVGTVIHEGGTWSATKQADGTWLNYRGDIQHVGINPSLRYLSLPEEAGPRFEYGRQVSRGEQQSCVAGAVFAYHSDSSRYIWGRTDVGAQAHGCIGLTIGYESTCTSNSATTVIWDGISPLHEVPIRDHREMEMLPIGTIIGQGTWEGSRFHTMWHKDAADHWTPFPTGGGRTGASAGFTTAQLRYVYIPVPGVPRPDGVPDPSASDLDDDF